MSDNERDDWDNLLKSSGFQRLQQWAAKEWGEQIAQLMAGAINDTNDLVALSKMRQVIAAKKAVDVALGRPKERLMEMDRQVTTTQGMGRGGL